MTKMTKLLKALLLKLTAQYQVHALYETENGNWVVAVHYARNYEDAIAWMACYQACDYVRVYDSLLGIEGNRAVTERGYTKFA